MTQKKPIQLGAFLSGAGSHLAGWRHPDAQLEASFDISHYVQYAKILEQAKFDALFLNDNFDLGQLAPHLLARNTHSSRWDPRVVLPALAMVTERIGLIATVNTSYNEPYNVARYFASLDALSYGRTGWNMVTALGGGENFNLQQHLAHDERYARAEEFVDVVNGLWQSWSPDALIRNKKTGIWVDPEKMNLLQYEGRYFKVKGPLTTPTSPQQKPVIAQAGSSKEGMALAARTADLVFTAQQEITAAQKFYHTIKQTAQQYGRKPHEIKIWTGISTVVGKSRQEAQEKYEQLQQLLDPVVIFQHILPYLNIEFDLEDLQLDQPVKLSDHVTLTQSHQSRQQLILQWIVQHQPTYRQLLYHLGAGGHRMVVGTAQDIADDLENWMDAGATDGFMLLFSHLPTALTDFTAQVIPELQQRQRFKTEYASGLLRQNLLMT